MRFTLGCLESGIAELLSIKPTTRLVPSSDVMAQKGISAEPHKNLIVSMD